MNNRISRRQLIKLLAATSGLGLVKVFGTSAPTLLAQELNKLLYLPMLLRPSDWTPTPTPTRTSTLPIQ